MKNKKIAAKTVSKISSTSRLEELLNETEKELIELEPQIEKLEKQLEKLKDLKLAKQKLITLKLSIKSILNNFSETQKMDNTTTLTNLNLSHFSSLQKLNKNETLGVVTSKRGNAALPAGIFLPEQAFAEASALLRKKTSINYELFRAIVFNGGRASTEEIKQYLLEHNIKQPASRESFEQVELTDISSRINYLVRKGLVDPDGRGNFVSRLGWRTD